MARARCKEKQWKEEMRCGDGRPRVVKTLTHIDLLRRWLSAWECGWREVRLRGKPRVRREGRRDRGRDLDRLAFLWCCHGDRSWHFFHVQVSYLQKKARTKRRRRSGMRFVSEDADSMLREHRLVVACAISTLASYCCGRLSLVEAQLDGCMYDCLLCSLRVSIQVKRWVVR
jgi:hypothetical protein